MLQCPVKIGLVQLKVIHYWTKWPVGIWTRPLWSMWMSCKLDAGSSNSDSFWTKGPFNFNLPWEKLRYWVYLTKDGVIKYYCSFYRATSEDNIWTILPAILNEQGNYSYPPFFKDVTPSCGKLFSISLPRNKA